MRLIPVTLALLLALSPGVVALQASTTAPATDVAWADGTVERSGDVVGPSDDATDGPDGTVESVTYRNTTAVMTLGTDPARTNFDSPSFSLGNTLAMDRDVFWTRLSVDTLDRQLEAARSAEKKKQILIRYQYRIENRIISLKARERKVTSAYSNGTISERNYLRTLGQIDAEADEIRSVINVMNARAENVPRFDLDTEALTLKGHLVTVEGPVRDRISRVVRGQTASTRIFVSTSRHGVALSTIAGDTYVREIVLQDLRDPSAAPNLSHLEAKNRVIEHYFGSHEARGTDTIRLGTTDIFSVSVNHEHGDLIAYVDGGTKNIFKEVQYKRLTGNESLPPGPGVVNATGNVTLTVNRTYPGGPLRVKLTNATGAPLRGQVTVAGEPVGRTNSEGVLWTLGPAEQFRVTATYEDATINVTATPVEPESS